MLQFGRKIAQFRIPLLIISFLLLIPAGWGYFHTKVNYDILYYLPDDIETMKGQEILLEDFGKGAYAMFVVNGMEDKEVSALKKKIEQVDHVAEVIWYDNLAGGAIPQEMLPQKYYDAFHSDKGTVMAIFFEEGTSSDTTMDAITEIRAISGKDCFLSSMSAIVTDTKNLTNQELFWYVLIAVVLSALVLAVTMDAWLAPVLFLTNIGMAIVYNLGTNFLTGEISFITMSLTAVLQLAVTMDYSIFLWNSYRSECKEKEDKKEAMASAIAKTISSVAGSSLTTIAGFIALCFMTFTLGMDLGVVMAKGVVLGVISCVTILPALILVCDKLIDKTSHKPITVSGDGIAAYVVKHKKAMLLLILLLIPAIFGYNKLQVYYDLTASLPEYLPSVQANEEMQNGYDMSTVHIVLARDDMAAEDVRAMVSDMEAVDGVSFALAGDSVIPSGIPSEFIPDSVKNKLQAGGHQIMVVGTEYPIASDEMNAQIDQLNAIVKGYDSDAMLIGEAPCTKDLIDITDHDFKVVSAVSIAAIFVLILLVLRSVTLPAILVLVIELAIYINMSISYYTGSVLPFIASIVIGTIQLGATVDYAILMTNRYLTERALGHEKFEATKIALSTSVESIVTSALGFFAATIGVGLYSDVDLIASLCLLIARGALISMILVLFLLPSLYIVADGLIMKTSWGLKRRCSAHEV